MLFQHLTTWPRNKHSHIRKDFEFDKNIRKNWLDKTHRQAGTELGQAQEKLVVVIVELKVDVNVETVLNSSFVQTVTLDNNTGLCASVDF